MSMARQATIPLIAALLLGTCWMMSAPPSPAEMFPAAVLATFKSGMVTSIGSSSIQIDRVDYQLKQGVEIVDHKGQPMPLAEIVFDSAVRFHLKQGQIDMMVVTRPQ